MSSQLKMFISLMALLELSVACGRNEASTKKSNRDLPKGWADATLVTNFFQEDCYQGDELQTEHLCEYTDAGTDGSTSSNDSSTTTKEKSTYTSRDCSEEINIRPGEQFVRIDYLFAHFRCSQPVEAFVRRGKSSVDVLVQPVDMNPDSIAECDCQYNIVMGIDDIPYGDNIRIRVYRRWDNINSDNDPEFVDERTVKVSS